MYARGPQAMAQIVLKIEKLSHIMGPTLILEMARAYGLRPRLWLLNSVNMMTGMGGGRGRGEDIEGDLRKLLDTQKGGSEN